MNKPIITKRIIQALAVVFGLLGLIHVLMGVYFAFQGIRESDDFVTLSMAPWFLLVGGILVAVAYQNLRRFGPNAIKNVTCLVTLVLYGLLASLAEPYLSTVEGLLGSHIDMAIHLVPLLVAIVFYRIVSKRLIQITKPQSPQPEAELTAGEPGDQLSA